MPLERGEFKVFCGPIRGMCRNVPVRASHFRLPGRTGWLKPRAQVVDQVGMGAEKSAAESAVRERGKTSRKKRRRRGRRLTDKIRAALARAATLGRRDVTEQLGTLYQERVEEELDQDWQRRARDPGFQLRRSRRGR